MNALSDMQARVAESRAPLLLVDAFAGCGKTSAIAARVLRNPGKRRLLLAFNRSAAQDMARRLTDVPGTEVRTIHSFAFSWLNEAGFSMKRTERGCLIPQNLSGIFGRLRNTERENTAAWGIVIDIFLRWCRSDTDAMESFLDAGFSATETSRMEALNFSVKDVRDVLLRMENSFHDPGGMPMDDSMYLKLAAMEMKHVRLPYEEIIVDEAQDANACVVGMLTAQKRIPKIFAGDPRQQIYGWNGSVNAFELLDRDAEHITLNTSFRCPDNIAVMAEPYLSLLGAKGFRGSRRPQNAALRKAVITRSRIGMFEQLRILRHREVSACDIGFFGGDYDFTFIFDTAALACGQPTETFRDFASIDDYEDWCRGIGLHSGLRTIAYVRKRNPEKILEDRRIHEERMALYNDKGMILLTTAHRAKGAEFPFVELPRGFAGWGEMAKKADSVDMEELRILYVALTRASQAISVNSMRRYTIPEKFFRRIQEKIKTGELVLHDRNAMGDLAAIFRGNDGTVR